MSKPIEYILLTNNTILIGKVSFEGDIIDIEDPYLMQSNGTEVLMFPFLESILKQKLSTFRTNISNVLSTIPVEKNDIMDTYIKAITNIEIPEKKIVV